MFANAERKKNLYFKLDVLTELAYWFRTRFARIFVIAQASRYIEKFDIFFDDTIRYDISISKTIYRYFRYIESSLVHYSNAIYG